MERVFDQWEQVIIVFCMVMVLMMLSGCRNESFRNADQYISYACDNSKYFLSGFAGLAILMVFYKNLKKKTENKKLRNKRRRANMK